ncbi:alpha/beta hydrolase [Actinomadura sp. 9N215]|uniref:alpha/beta hydrolase n=1 Tax=Actinomadura sp. 9N215 TaxID=3375150 RepID=UPI0037C188EB
MAYEAALAGLAVPCHGDTIQYGEASDQFGQIWPPAGGGQHPLAILLHGGYWRAHYGLDVMNAMAEDLAWFGCAAWNLEYRRVGTPGAGWPDTFEDVISGFEMIVGLAPIYRLDLKRVVIVGHSAGGQLALWLAAELARRSGSVRPVAVVALAPVADMIEAHRRRLSNDAPAELLGASYSERPERYVAASPAALVPLGVRQLIFHGTEDDSVPHEMSVGYQQAAEAEGDDCELISLPGVGHFELINPRTRPWGEIRHRIMNALE